MYLGELPNHPPRSKAPPGYQWVYETDGLSGLGRFRLKKVFKAITRVAVAPFKAIVKVSKKLVDVVKKHPILLLPVAAWAAAPWMLSLAAKVGPALAQSLFKQHAPQMTPEEAAAAAASSELPPWMQGPADAAIQAQLSRQQQSYLTQPSQPSMFANQPSQPSYYSGQPQPSQETSSIPSWLAPVGIGAALLITILR